MTLSLWYQKSNKSENPGPGSYDIPDQFGEGPKPTMRGRPKERRPDPEPQMYRLPSTLSHKSTSFGCRVNPRPADPTPAPSQRHVEMGKDSPKYSFRSRPKDPKNTNPSPAEYTIDRDLNEMPQSIGYGPRTDFIDPNFMIPPGLYDIPTLFHETKQLTLGPSIPLPSPKPFGPGPIYNMRYKMGSDTPHFTLTKSPRDALPDNSVGPAEYSISRDLLNPNAVSTCLKGRPPLPHGDICDYPYHNIGTTITPRKVSHGIRPKTVYETPSPGPKYEILHTMEKRPLTIGLRTRIPNPMDETPSPVAYFKTPLPPPTSPLVFGPPGPQGRCPIDPEKEAENPGPGYYEEIGQFETGKVRGYNLASRGPFEWKPTNFHFSRSELK